MIMFFKILVLRLYLFKHTGKFLPVEYLKNANSKLFGCRIKLNKSVEEAVNHPITGKVIYYKHNYQSVTFNYFGECMFIDQWSGNTLKTFDLKLFSQFDSKNFMHKLNFMTTLFFEVMKKSFKKA